MRHGSTNTDITNIIIEINKILYTKYLRNNLYLMVFPHFTILKC